MEIDRLDWNKGNGLIPAIVQDSRTGRVLMLGFMNRAAFKTTLQTGLVTFWSRSRQELWTKGETSGNKLVLEKICTDCDHDSVLVLAHPQGPTCHRGTRSCFFEDREFHALEMLGHLEALVRQRKTDLPENSYTTRLFQQGIQEISKKVGEEAIELILSRFEGRQRTVEEAADLLYHVLVLLAEQGVDLRDVTSELVARHTN